MSVGQEQPVDPPFLCAYEREQVDRLAMETAAKLEELRIAVEALAICEQQTVSSTGRRNDTKVHETIAMWALSVAATQIGAVKYQCGLMKTK